jgi:pectate lyase
MNGSFRTRTGTLPLAVLLAGAGFASAASKTDTPLGWASQNGGTTGGTGGTEVTVTTMSDLQKYAKASGKYIIWVSGTMGSYGVRGNGNEDIVSVASDKSILGLPGAHVKGNITMNGVKNVILRNLTMEGPGACDNSCGSAGESRQDAITVLGATNIWIDHMDVFDGEDGNTDITKNANYVTVSWVKFHYTDKSYPSGTSGYSHRYCNLIGSDDSYTSDAGKLKTTFYKTWWGEGVAERMPRVRFGQIHVANCLFTSTDAGQNHCIRAGYKADILAESNAFIGQKKPIDLYNNDFTAVTSKNNLFSNCSGNTSGSGTSFTPPYTLSLSATSGLQAEISNTSTGAGPNLTWGTTSIAPVPGHETNEAVRMERRDGREFLTNPAQSPAWVSLWNLTGSRLSPEYELAAGGRMELPAVDGSRVLQVRTPYGNESRILSLR